MQTRFADRIKHKPYSTVGFACLLGTGLGIVLSSRILRGAVTGAATAAAIELSRALVKQGVLRIEAV